MAVEHDTVHMQFLEGTQNRLHVPCQSSTCGAKAELEFENLKAEHPTTHKCVKWGEVPGARDADGKWDLEILAPDNTVQPTLGSDPLQNVVVAPVVSTE